VIVGISIADMNIDPRPGIIDRPSIIIITACTVTVMNDIVTRQPAGVDPAIAVAIEFPVTRNPISSRVGNQLPVALNPDVFAKAGIPRPVAVDPHVVGTRSGKDRRLDRYDDFRSKRNPLIERNMNLRFRHAAGRAGRKNGEHCRKNKCHTCFHNPALF
jgi:hypothetical protein